MQPNNVAVVAAFAAACIALPAAAETNAPDPGVARILHQTQAALGQAALQHGGVLRVEGRVTSNGLSGTGTSAGRVGGVQFSERQSTPPLVAGDGYDGASAWNQDQSGLVWVDGSIAGVSQEIDNAFVFNDTLFSSGAGGATVASNGFQSAGGRRYAVLTATPPQSQLPFQVWIDAATHLPAKYVVNIGPQIFTTALSDYRMVAGLLVPYRVHAESSTGNATDVTLTAGRIEGAEKISLAKPASTVSDFSIQGGGTSTSVPIELIDNHVYLDVMLNGKGPYRFVFDTGGSNLIDPAVAKEIGTTGAGSLEGGGAGSQTESFSFGTVKSLEVGKAMLKDQVFAVVPIRKGFGIGAGQSIDGLIGFEVLARFVTTFDYANRTVTFAMPGAPPPAAAGIVPFVFGSTQPQFACNVDGIAAQCSVDTGARDSLSFLTPFVASHPQIVPATRSEEGVSGFGVGGGARGYLGRLSSLQLGQYTLPDLVADFSTQKEGFFASPFLAANVGGGVWKRFTVTFDYGKQTIALQPNANFDVRDSYERAGLFLINNGGKVVVYDVRPGTPAAAAGIVKGETIVSIDGTPPQSLKAARDAVTAPAGTVLHLQLAAKDGTTRAVTLTLRDWV
jgi:hypothetical protein